MPHPSIDDHFPPPEQATPLEEVSAVAAVGGKDVAPAAAVRGRRGWPAGWLIGGFCMLALGGGGFLLWQGANKPAPVPVDPATTVRRSPGTVPPPTSTGTVKRTGTLGTADPHNKISTTVTPWSKVEAEREAARAAWLKAEAERRERERQAAIAEARRRAAEEAARRERLAAQRTAEEAARQAQAAALARQQAAAAASGTATPQAPVASGAIGVPSEPASPVTPEGIPATPPESTPAQTPPAEVVPEGTSGDGVPATPPPGTPGESTPAAPDTSGQTTEPPPAPAPGTP